MSRAPANETPVSALNAALTPFGVIDFVDNGCMQATGGGLAAHAGAAHANPAHPGVVGGPPAYLEAHGIRYVPSASLESDSASPMSADPAATDYGISASAKQVAAAAPASVSQRELNSRVDSRIRKFMKEGGSLGAEFDDDPLDPGEKVRALRRDIEMSRSYQADRGGRSALDCEDRGVTEQLRSLHRQIQQLEDRQSSGRSADRDIFSARRNADFESMEPRSVLSRPRRGMSPEIPDRDEMGMRAEARLASLRAKMSAAASASPKDDSFISGAERLRALRRECEEAAAVAKQRLAQSAEPARASKGRTGKKPDIDY